MALFWRRAKGLCLLCHVDLSLEPVFITLFLPLVALELFHLFWHSLLHVVVLPEHHRQILLQLTVNFKQNVNLGAFNGVVVS